MTGSLIESVGGEGEMGEKQENVPWGRRCFRERGGRGGEGGERLKPLSLYSMSSPLIRFYSLSTLSIWTNVFWAILWSLSASALIHLLFLLPSCSHLTLFHSSTVISGVSECQRRTNSRMLSNRHWVMNWVWSITIRSYPNPFPLLPFILSFSSFFLLTLHLCIHICCPSLSFSSIFYPQRGNFH